MNLPSSSSASVTPTIRNPPLSTESKLAPSEGAPSSSASLSSAKSRKHAKKKKRCVEEEVQLNSLPAASDAAGVSSLTPAPSSTVTIGSVIVIIKEGFLKLRKGTALTVIGATDHSWKLSDKNVVQKKTEGKGWALREHSVTVRKEKLERQLTRKGIANSEVVKTDATSCTSTEVTVVDERIAQCLAELKMIRAPKKSYKKFAKFMKSDSMIRNFVEGEDPRGFPTMIGAGGEWKRDLRLQDEHEIRSVWDGYLKSVANHEEEDVCSNEASNTTTGAVSATAPGFLFHCNDRTEPECLYVSL